MHNTPIPFLLHPCNRRATGQGEASVELQHQLQVDLKIHAPQCVGQPKYRSSKSVIQKKSLLH